MAVAALVLIVLASETVPVNLGAEIRLRAEAMENALDLTARDDSLPRVSPDRGDTVWVRGNDGMGYLRLRTRVWMEGAPHEGTKVFIRLGNEYRMGRGELTSGVRDPDTKVSLDNAWVKLCFRRAELTLGRQDLQYGEGFLIFDGTPADGSASAWFDAVLVSLRGRTRVDLLWALVDEEGFGAGQDSHLGGLVSQRGPWQAYLLRRTRQRGFTTPSQTRHRAGATNVVGGRWAPSGGALSAAAEAAYQWGWWGRQSRRAWGGYLRSWARIPVWFGPTLEVGGLFLSGDDPQTERYEAWDSFFGEWPKYSELLVYTLYDGTTRLATEPGTWTNLTAGWAEVRREGRGGWIAGRVCALGAPHGGQRGHTRGILVQARAQRALVGRTVAQVWVEAFWPGSFFREDAVRAYYGRCQLTTAL